MTHEAMPTLFEQRSASACERRWGDSAERADAFRVERTKLFG
jgi:hypothetical protein